MPEEQRVRTRISRGYQVVVPAEVRHRHNLDVGDEVIWEMNGKAVVTEFRRKPSLFNIVALGRSGDKGGSAEKKKRVQGGER